MSCCSNETKEWWEPTQPAAGVSWRIVPLSHVKAGWLGWLTSEVKAAPVCHLCLSAQHRDCSRIPGAGLSSLCHRNTEAPRSGHMSCLRASVSCGSNWGDLREGERWTRKNGSSSELRKLMQQDHSFSSHLTRGPEERRKGKGIC